MDEARIMTRLARSGAPEDVNEKEKTDILDNTRHWLEQAVIGLNLCPFAKAVHVRHQIRFAVSEATTAEALQRDLAAELLRLQAANEDEIDTTLLIHPFVLTDFYDYNDFLEVAESTLEQLGLDGEIQIASFHPAYQFADAGADDITNYTNRAPYPILHLLRETSVERAVEAFPDASRIYERNMDTMRRLGISGWRKLMLKK